jgi:HAD superfamily hydrolase (TIGR01509 family)
METEKMKLKLKGIVLDLDGTIVDSSEAYLEAAKAAFAAVGQAVDINIAKEIPRKLEQNLPIGNMIRGMDAQKFLDIYINTYHQATPEKTKLMPKIPETLEKLSTKVKLALMTMRYVPREKVIEELEKFGLAKYFQLVVTASDNYYPKPSPEALVKCANHLCLQVSECAVVGDSIVDVRTGRNAGAVTVAVLSGIFMKEELEKEKPDLILKSISELPDFIE